MYRHMTLTVFKQCQLWDLCVHGGISFNSRMRDSRGWWLGFDCAHAWDVSPGMATFYEGLGMADMVYRDISFVQAEVTALAQQIARAS